MAQTEGAKFWLSVMNELKNRGVKDIFIACCDGLKGFPEAIEAVYPKTQVQLCIVHQIRHSLRYVNWKQRKVIAADLKRIYGAATLAEAELALAEFAEKWDDQHPTISLSWRNNWARLSVFFDYPPEIRKVIYTTNAIESLNASLRKITKTRRSFPTDDSVMKYCIRLFTRYRRSGQCQLERDLLSSLIQLQKLTLLFVAHPSTAPSVYPALYYRRQTAHPGTDLIPSAVPPRQSDR